MDTIPLELKQANDFVARLHRHHKPVHRDKFRFGCVDNGNLVGIIQCARPVNRNLDDGKTLEVVRLCTDGRPNACSFLYSRAARIAKIMGYERVITYTLESENGASLKASGFILDGITNGGGYGVAQADQEIQKRQQTRKNDGCTCAKNAQVVDRQEVENENRTR